MSRTTHRTGFTLLEMMVASSISLIILAGALWSAAELQRRGLMEESLMDAQNALRIVRELLENEVQRAGGGMGSARLVFGSRAGVPDTRYVIAVGTNDIFDGKGLFDKDATFVPPKGDYVSRISDAVQMWSWDTDPPYGSAPTTNQNVMPLTPCAHDATYADSTRTGDKLCLNGLVGDQLLNRVVMVVRPSTRVACVMKVLSLDTTSYRYAVATVSAWMPVAGEASATSGACASAASGYDLSFWTYNKQDGLYLLPLRGVAFRVNWATGVPTLERQDFPPLASGVSWVQLSTNVEQVKVRLGVMKDLSDPLADVQFFPETSPPRPPIDQCTPSTCNGLVPVPVTGSWAPSTDEPDARDALMRRTRMVELLITSRTTRADPALVSPSGAKSAFALDAQGNPRDGFKRRTSTLEVMPRNFDYAGVVTTP